MEGAAVHHSQLWQQIFK